MNTGNRLLLEKKLWLPFNHSNVHDLVRKFETTAILTDKLMIPYKGSGQWDTNIAKY